MQEKFTLPLAPEDTAPACQPDPGIALMTINQIEVEIKARAGMITENIIIIGKMLMDVKGRLDHGQFMNWLKDKVNFSQSTANIFMRIAREIPRTPGLVSLPYTKALALLDVPEAEREQFAQENNVADKPTREIQRLIQEKEAAEKAKQEAEAAAKVSAEQLETQRHTSQHFQNLADQYSQEYYKENERANILSNKLDALTAAPAPPPTEIEVPPADYEEWKARAAQAEQRAEEAERYAMEQEAARQQAQGELRKMKETRADMPLRGNNPLSLECFSSTIKQFMGQVGMAPNMAPFFRAMEPDALHAYAQWVDVLAEWVDGTRQAIAEGSQYVDVPESAVV